MNTLFLILFIVLTLAVHSLLAWSAGEQMTKLGFNRARWTLFILIGGIPAMLVFQAQKRDALKRLEAERLSRRSEV